MTAIASDPFAFLKSSPVAAPPEPAVAVQAAAPVVATKTPATRNTSSSKLPLYIDIETIPDESREALFDLPAAPQPAEYLAENDCPAPSKLVEGTEEQIKSTVAKAQSNGKMLPRVILQSALEFEAKREKGSRKGVASLFSDAIKVIDNESVTIQSSIDSRRKTMSLTPEMCRIVSLGWAVGNEVPECLVVGQPKADGSGMNSEQDLLRKFWELAGRGGPVIGFNLLGFDLPVIFIRSILLDIAASKKFDMKPWGTDVVDLMLARFPKSQAKPLKTLCTLMGIEVPADGVEGSQVAEMFAKDPAKLAEYNRSDIVVTRQLHRKYKGYLC